MKILIVDDHVLIRDALRSVIRELIDHAIMFDASDCRQAMHVIEAHPDLHLGTKMGARSGPLYGQYVRPTTFFLDGEESEFLFQRDIAPFLRALGYAYSTSEINRLCSPAVNRGPPIARWYGPRPLRRPTDVIGWAEERLQAKMRRIFNGKRRVRPGGGGDGARHVVDTRG
jgi:hypothetical protein